MKRAISILTVIYILIGVLANAYSQESALKDINEKIKIEDEKKFDINNFRKEEIDNHILPAFLELVRNKTNKIEIKEKYRSLYIIMDKYYLYNEKAKVVDLEGLIYFMFDNLKYDKDQINKNLDKYLYVDISPIKLIEDFDGDGDYEILFDVQEFIDEACTFNIIDIINGDVQEIISNEGLGALLGTYRGDYSFNKKDKIIVFESKPKNIYIGYGKRDNKMVDYWQDKTYTAEYKYSKDGKITKISGPTLIEGEMEIKFREETPPPGLTIKPATPTTPPGQEKKQ